MRRKILAGGMTLVMVGVLLGACGVPQEDLDAAEDALAAAEAETVAAQDDIDAAELATRLATDSIATLEADLAAAQVTLAELQAVEDAIAAAKAAEEAAAAAAGTYTNEEYGFTVTYPLDLEVQEVDSTPDEETGSISLFTALGPWSDPGVYVSVSDVVEGESYVGTFAPEEGEEGTDYVIVSNTQVETSDGSTGSLVQYTYTWDIYPLNAAGFAVEMDGELIIVSVSSGTMGLAALAEIATNLTLTGDAAGLGTAPDDEGEGEGVVPDLDGEVVEDEVVEEEVAGEAAYGYEHPAELSFAGSAVEEISEDWSASFQHDGTFSGDLSGIAYTGSWGYGLTFTTYPAADFDTFEAALLGDGLLSDLEILNLYETALADGTPASLAEFTAITDTFPFHVFSIGVVHGDYWVVIHVRNWTDSGEAYDEAYMAEIVHTLTLTGAAEEEVVEDEVVEDGDAAAGALEALVTTFDSTLWTSEEYGIEVNYPTAWEVQELTGEANDEGATLIFSAGVAPYNSPAVTVSVADIVEGESHTDANIRGATEPEWVTYEVTSEDATTTRDGTAATILTVEGMWDVYPVPMYELRAEVNGQYITVNVAGTAADAEEIVRSLTITGAAAGGDAGDADAVVEEVVLSFEAATYTNEEYGFSIQYPANWAEGPLDTDDQVFTADAPACCPGLTVYVFDDTGESASEGLETDPPGTDFVNLGEVELTLADGSTTTAVWSTWTSTYDFDSITILVPLAGGKRVSFNVWQIQAFGGAVDAALYEEILSTLLIE